MPQHHLSPLHPLSSGPTTPVTPLIASPRGWGAAGRSCCLARHSACSPPSFSEKLPPPSPSALHAEAEISEITFNYSHYFPWECWSERQHLAVSHSRAVPFLLPPAAARGAAPIATRASDGGREGAPGENQDEAVGSGDGCGVLRGLGMGSRLPPGSGSHAGGGGLWHRPGWLQEGEQPEVRCPPQLPALAMPVRSCQLFFPA